MYLLQTMVQSCSWTIRHKHVCITVLKKEKNKESLGSKLTISGQNVNTVLQVAKVVGFVHIPVLIGGG